MFPTWSLTDEKVRVGRVRHPVQGLTWMAEHSPEPRPPTAHPHPGTLLPSLLT